MATQSFNYIIDTVGRKAFGDINQRDLCFAKAKSSLTFFTVKVYMLPFNGTIAALLAYSVF
jgi:hypothetical protein